MKIKINQILYDISHLSPITRRMDITLTRGVTKSKNVVIKFRFSCHCYSRSPKEGESIPLGMLVKDGSEQSPRNRIFSEQRYQLSKQLIKHIDKLISEDGLVSKTRKGTFFSTKLALVDEGGCSIQIDYYVFMNPTKKQDPNFPKHIDIYIESAYPPDGGAIPKPNTKGMPEALSKVLGDVWEQG